MKQNTPDHPLLDFLPESVITLNREVALHHQHLFKKYPNLASLWGTPESLGILAAECNIAVNGSFDDTGIDALCGLIIERLVARRSPTKELPSAGLVLPPGYKPH